MSSMRVLTDWISAHSYYRIVSYVITATLQMGNTLKGLLHHDCSWQSILKVIFWLDVRNPEM